MRLVHALMLAAVLAGCSSKASDDSVRPAPRVTQTVTASPTPSDTPTADVTHYRMLTVLAGHADVTFVVAMNGNTVGTLNGETNGDVTPSVLPGNNTVVVSWTSAHPLKAGEKATLTIERQIPAQDGWTTVFSRAVDSTTRIKEARGTFSNEAIGDNSAAGGTLEGSSGGGYSPANSTSGSTSGSNATAGTNGTVGTNSTTGSNLTTAANSSRSVGNSTTGANLSQPGTLPGRGAAGNTSPMTP